MLDDDEQIRNLVAELEALRVALDRLHEAIPAQSERAKTLAETARTRAAALKSLLRFVQSDVSTLQAELETAERSAWENKAKRADLAARLSKRDQAFEQIQKSAWWKIVKPFWKLANRSREKIAIDATGELLFSLDAPKSWTTSREILLIRGWCFSPTGKEIAGVRAKVGRKGRLARYGIERPDVVESAGHWPISLRSGFTVEIQVPAGTTTVRLEAIAQGEDWQPFFEHELVRDASHIDEEAASFPPARLRRRSRHPLARYQGISAEKAVALLRPLFEQHQNRVATEQPFFSIVTAAFNTKPEWLTEAAVSLLSQSFSDWEWCIVDDGSDRSDTRKLLEQLDGVNSRLRIKRTTNGGISAATNHALDLARGEFVCFLDHDDLLDRDALETMAEKLREGFDIVYSDEDKLDDASGQRVEQFFKPDWSPEYFRGVMYVGHLLCVRRELAQKTRFDGELDGVQDFDFMLRLSETGARIGHIPEILYHWRKTAGSIAERTDAKPGIGLRQQRAVNAHLARVGLPAQAEIGALPHRLLIAPASREFVPKISLIIPTKDAPELIGRCLTSLFGQTSYPDFEVLLMDNETTNAGALALFEKFPLTRIPFPNPFNFSRANNLGAARATGRFLVFLNNDTEITNANWLEHLLYYAEQPDVGAAGAVLVYENHTVQHAGVALGMRGTADHVMRGFPLNIDGYAGSLACAREVSAVTGACMMLRRSLFEEVGGFNEHFFTAYQDVDLCLRLRERGLRIICTPRASLVHHESVSRKNYYDMVDRMLLLDQWEPVIERGDPYYNPHLDLERGDYSARRAV